MKRKMYLNHDGGVDDLVSLFLLLQETDVELLGVGVTDADCYVVPAVSASRKIIQRFGQEQQVPVFPSNSRAKNPFPKEWRMHAFTVDAMPYLNEFPLLSDMEPTQWAHEHLRELLETTNLPIELLFTGPLTDLARVITKQPELSKKISRLYWMGGTFLEKGNVEEPGHDGTAEWNAFWDPEATKNVWDTDIPMTVVALESTNMVPLTIPVREAWAKQRKHPGIDFLGQAYAMVPPLSYDLHLNSTYFLWDVLATIVACNSKIAKSREVKGSVIASGVSSGRTVLDHLGKKVELIYEVEPALFFEYITSLAQSIS